MSDNESSHSSPTIGQHRYCQEDALQLGPRKKPMFARCLTDPLVYHGRHFGRTEHALCSIRTLLKNGLLRITEFAGDPDMDLTTREKKEHHIFQALLRMVPGLEDRIVSSSDEEIRLVADLIQKGVSSARSDDTKSLKAAIIGWISPQGQALDPPLARNSKTDRGFNHSRTGFLLCPAGLDWSDAETRENLRRGHLQVSGDQWPLFLYQDYSYDPDDPWKGLLRSSIMVSAYKHIFTSPSSVGKEPKATRSGNAQIHGMVRVTRASIGYVATQVRFCLSSSPVFSRTDTATDSERFYTSVLDLLNDPDEADEVKDLLQWWDRQIFPGHSAIQSAPAKNSVLAKIRAKRAAMKAAQIAHPAVPSRSVSTTLPAGPA